MRSSTRILLAAAGLAAGFCLNMATAEPGRSPDHPTPDEFAPVGQAVLEVLQTRDTGRFAKALAPRMQDYHDLVSTNRLAEDKDLSKSMGMTQAFQRGGGGRGAGAAGQ